MFRFLEPFCFQELLSSKIHLFRFEEARPESIQTCIPLHQLIVSTPRLCLSWKAWTIWGKINACCRDFLRDKSFKHSSGTNWHKTQVASATFPEEVSGTFSTSTVQQPVWHKRWMDFYVLLDVHAAFVFSGPVSKIKTWYEPGRPWSASGGIEVIEIFILFLLRPAWQISIVVAEIFYNEDRHWIFWERLCWNYWPVHGGHWPGYDAGTKMGRDNASLVTLCDCWYFDL